MPNPPYILDASADNFARLVLCNSAKGPVEDGHMVRCHALLQAAIH